MPITTVAAADTVRRPNPPNTARNPAAIAAVAVTARATAACRSTSSPRTTRARYAGSMAKPHGFSAANKPAPKAKPTRSWSTVRGDLGQRRYPVGQLLGGHGRGRVVHERRRAVGTVEHVSRLPRDVVARRDADEGDAGIGRRDLADAGRLSVAEGAPRRPEPQHGRLANEARPAERRARQRRPGELQPVVRDRRRRTDKPERQRSSHRAECE